MMKLVLTMPITITAGWALLALRVWPGLRRPKSVEHQRMAASGINVKTV
jgi:hypothetical protein